MALEPIIEGSEELPGGELDRSSKKGFVFSAVFLFFMMLAVPIGIYLATNRTNILPQADSPAVKIGEISMKLDAPQIVGVGKEFKMMVLVHSDVDSANLFSAAINFPTERFEVVRIVDESVDDLTSKKWIERTFDNQAGELLLTVGVGAPGIKTEPDKNYAIGEIIFKAKTAGPGVISLGEESVIYRNSDNINVLSRKVDANISVEGSLILESPTPSCVARPACLDKPDLISKSVKFSSEEEELKRRAEVCKLVQPKEGWCQKDYGVEVTAPVGGEAFYYNQIVPITWSSSGLEEVQISILINDSLLGKVATASAISGKYEWRPSDKLDLSLVKPTNSFKIRVSGKGGDLEVVGESNGPFEIFNQDSLPTVATRSAELGEGTGDFNKDNQISLIDLSILLSHYLVGGDQVKEYDINHDNFINDLDLWLVTGLIR